MNSAAPVCRRIFLAISFAATIKFSGAAFAGDPPKTNGRESSNQSEEAGDEQTPAVLLLATERTRRQLSGIVGEIVVHDDGTYRWTVHRHWTHDMPTAEYTGTVTPAILGALRSALQNEPVFRSQQDQRIYDVHMYEFRTRDPAAIDDLRVFLEETHLQYENDFIGRGPALRIANEDGSFQAHSVIGRRRELAVATSANVLAVSPNGAILALVGLDDDNYEQGAISLWDIAAEQEVGTVLGPGKGFYSVAWSPESERFATGGEDGVVSIWEVNGPRRIATLEHHAGVVIAISFSPDGTILATGDGKGSVILWDLESGRPRAEINLPDVYVVKFGYTNQGQHLIVVDSHGGVRIIDVAAGKVAEGPFNLEVQRNYNAAILPMRNYVATGLRLVKVLVFSENTTELCSFDAFPKQDWPSGFGIPTWCAAYDMVFSPDGRHLAIGSGTSIQGIRPYFYGEVTFLNHITGKVIGYLDADNGDWVMRVAYLPDSRLVTVDRAGVATIWTLADHTHQPGDSDASGN